MKKTLMAAAMLGLFSSAAFAADKVTMYGIMDLGVAHYDNGANTVTNMSQGGVSNSRIGLTGKEELGGGLNAIFKLETGVCAQGGPLTSGGYCSGGGFFQRQSWVGLEGGFGTLRLGRYYTYSDLDLYDFDPFTDNTVAGVGNLPEKWIPVRFSQSITYDSPSFGGFDVGAQMAFGDGSGLTSSTASRTIGGYGLRARYLGGPIRVSLESTVAKDANGNATTKDIRISGAYDFGIMSLRALYGQNSPDSAVVSKYNKQKYYMVGASIPMGPGSLLASYTQIKNDTVANAGAKQIGLGYWYNLSKRTTLYVNYSHISNDANALYTVGVGNDAPKGPNGSTTSGFMFGMKHSF
jgi:predicted porin